MSETTAIVLRDPEGYKARMRQDRDANFWRLCERGAVAFQRGLLGLCQAFGDMADAGVAAGLAIEALSRDLERALPWHRRLAHRLRRAWRWTWWQLTRRR